MPKEELRGALHLEQKLWAPVLERLVVDGAVVDRGPAVARPTHRVLLSREAERDWQEARRRLAADETQPPSSEELGLDADVIMALAERGDLVRLTSEIVLLPSTVRRFAGAILQEAATSGPVSVSRARFDACGT